MKKNLLKMSALLVLMTFVMSFANAQTNAPSCLSANGTSITQPSNAPDYSGKAVILAESFDGTTFPPTGWTAVAGSGTYNWERVTSGTYPTCTPHSGAAMIKYNCWSAGSGQWAVLTSPVVNLTGNAGAYTVALWMFHDVVYTGDHVEIYANTTASLTGATLIGDVLNNDGTTGWGESVFPIPAAFNTATNYIMFKAISAYGNGMYVDDISVTSPEAHDFGVLAVTPTFVLAGSSVIPTVTIKNFGATNEATWSVTLTDGGSYTSTKANLSTINSGATLVVPMDNWTPANGTYTLTATTTLTGDANPANNTMTINCSVGSYDNNTFTGNTTGLTYNTINLTNGATTPIGTIGSSPFPMCEEYDGTAIYRIYNNLSIGTVAPDGTYAPLGTMTGVSGTPTAMAYDWTNHVMYVVVLNSSNLPQLCTLNLSTLVLTLVGTGTEGMIIGMDFADDGYIYAPSLNPDNLYQIDPATGATTSIGPIGIDINYGQDVTYNAADHLLYSITCGGAYSFGTYSLTTGAFTTIQTMGSDQYATLVCTVRGDVGIKEINNQSNIIKVYPNPANSVVSIVADNYLTIQTMKVLSITGQVIEEMPVNNYIAQFNVSNYKAGVYFVQVKTEKGLFTKKITVTK